MAFTVVTANIPNRVAQRKLRRWLKRYLTKRPRRGLPPPSIFVGQEFTHAVNDFKAVMPKYWKIMSMLDPQPFAFDTREWKFLEMDGVLVYGKTRVGKEGAGPAVLAERYVQWVKLKHKKGNKAHLYIFNTHAPPSIHVPLQPDGDISRDDLHELLMNSFAEKIDRTPNPVIFMGDMNAGWDHDNMYPLHQVGLILANDLKKPTHGRRIIDIIAFRGGKRKRWKLQKIAAGVFKKLIKRDHAAAWATFRFVR